MKLEWSSCFRAGVTLFLLYLASQYWHGFVGVIQMLFSAAMPLILGAVIAYILNILMSFYERHWFPKSQNTILLNSRRPVCMIGSMVTLVAVVVFVILLVVPELVSCVQLLLSEIPEAMSNVILWVNKLDVLPENISQTLSSIDWRSKIGQVINVLLSGLGNVTDILINAVSVVASSVVSFFLGLIFAIYLLSGKEKLGSQFDRLARRYVRKSWYDRLRYVLRVINDCFHRYIVGQCTEAVILGVLCAAGMILLRLPYATMIGALIAFTALIPVAGAYIGAGVGAFMILTVSPIKALIFLVFIVVLQQLEGNLIYPKVVGSSMGLPAIWVLAAVTVGGGIMGIAGMLLGVPIAAAIYRLVKDDVNNGLPVSCE